MVVKFISNIQAKLYIDQELVVQLEANTMFKYNLEVGTYLLEVIPNDCQIPIYMEDFDLSEEKQVLKRINFTNDILLKSNLIEEENIYSEKSQPKHELKEVYNSNGIAIQEYETIFEGDYYSMILKGNQLICKSAINNEVLEEYEVIDGIKEEIEFAVSKKVNGELRYGFINIEGEETLPFIYDETHNFNSQGYAIAKRYGIERFINREGKVCILNTEKDIYNKNRMLYFLDSSKYEWCGKLVEPNKKSRLLDNTYFIPVVKKNKWGCAVLLNDYGTNTLKEIVSCDYDEILYLYTDWAMILFRKGNFKYLVNLNGVKYSDNHEKRGQYVVAPVGEVLYTTRCDELYPIIRIETELVCNSYDDWGTCYELYFPHAFVVGNRGKYGISLANNEIPDLFYDEIFIKMKDNVKHYNFSERDFLIARKGSYYGLLNAYGCEITPFCYKDIFKIGDFYAAKEDKDYILIDKNGIYVSSLFFDDIRYENEEYILCKNGKENIYSPKIKSLLFNYRYDHIEHIEYKIENSYDSPKYAYLCTLNGKKGVLKEDGTSILECIYDDIRPLKGFAGTCGVILGYSLMQNGLYGWTNNDGYISDCIYNDLQIIGKFDLYILLNKDNLWGLFSDNGNPLIDMLFNNIRYLDTISSNCYEWNEDDDDSIMFVERFLCSRDSETHIISNRGTIYDSLEFDEVIPINGSTELCLIRNEEYYGILKDLESIVLDCDYERIKLLYANKEYVYLQVIKDKEKFFVMCNSKKYSVPQEIRIEYDEIFIVDNYVQNKYTFSSNDFSKNNKVAALVFVENGKQGVLGLNGELLFPAIYDEITRVEKSEDDMFIFAKQNGLLAVFNTNQRCIIPFAYPEIRKLQNVFIVTKNSLDGLYSINGRILLPCKYNSYIRKELNYHEEHEYDCLKSTPKSLCSWDDIPIEIWSTKDKKYVAFNSKSGDIIIGNPMSFDDAMFILKKYKEKYLETFKSNQD